MGMTEQERLLDMFELRAAITEIAEELGIDISEGLPFEFWVVSADDPSPEGKK